MPYVPNATDTTEPLASQSVESAALEFRTLKTSINSRVTTEIANRVAGDAALQAELDQTQVELDLDEVRITALEQLAFNGSTPGAVSVTKFTADGVSAVYTLPVTPITVSTVDVYIRGIHQESDTYSIVGNTLTLSTVPTLGWTIEVKAGVPLSLGITTADQVEYFPAGTGAVATTVQTKLRESVSVLEFSVPNDGTTNATTAIQAMITAIAGTGVKEIYFPPGTYLLQAPASETGEPRSYAAAVIWKQLKNVRITGAKGTLFTQNSGGAGAPEFAMFRFEECENIEMCNFAANGSGINIYGTGAARSSFAYICNHDLNTFANLSSPNLNVHIHHLILNNFGGGICSATRNENTPYPLVTKGVSIHDIQASNIAGQNHFVATTYTENVHVYNNKVINPLTAAAQIGNLFADMSAGTINAIVENNYAIGFTGGAKAESHTGAGVAFNEDRFSQNVCYRNNTFEQMGDPVVMIYPGVGGGGWYGIKLNGINHSAYNNTITARTTNRTTGGLYQGIQLTTVNTTPVESLHTVFGNDIKGPVIGINHDSPVDTLHKYCVQIYGNKIFDTYAPTSPVAGNDGAGLIISRNATVYNNRIYRTPYAAVEVTFADQTIIKDNIAYNCVTINHPLLATKVVFQQDQSGSVGYFEFTNNVIFDDRGAGAANYGYFLYAGTTYTNKYVFNPGLTNAVTTGVSYDPYYSIIGTSMPLNGTVINGPRTVYTTNSPALVAPWNGMAWNAGDRAVFRTPTVGVPKAWVCTVAGTPGTWVSEGNL